MIVTLTLNPALDRELTVDTFAYDTVLRANSQRVDAGGKGFNVSRMIAQLGGHSVATGLAAGHSGAQLESLLTAQRIETRLIWIEGETRTNISIVGEGRYIKVNEQGAHVSAENLADLRQLVAEMAQAGDYWVLAGSLPPGISAEFYAEAIQTLKAAGVHVILDTSRAPLEAGCRAAPYVVKPNLAEAEAITGCKTPQLAAAAIHDMGVAVVIISLGADGILLSTDPTNQSIIAAPTIVERNPIGAGDAFVGGFVWALADGRSLDDAARWGIACGSTAASLPGTTFGDRQMIEAMLARLPSEIA